MNHFLNKLDFAILPESCAHHRHSNRLNNKNKIIELIVFIESLIHQAFKDGNATPVFSFGGAFRD